MKKLLISLALVVCLAAPAFAVDPNWGANPNMPLSGRYGATKAYTFTDNVAVTLATMYITGWVDATSGFSPIGAIVSVETQDARFSCGGGTPTVSGLGHLLAAGSSYQFSTVAGENCKFIPKTGGSYPLIQLTPIYSK